MHINEFRSRLALSDKNAGRGKIVLNETLADRDIEGLVRKMNKDAVPGSLEFTGKPYDAGDGKTAQSFMMLDQKGPPNDIIYGSVVCSFRAYAGKVYVQVAVELD